MHHKLLQENLGISYGIKKKQSGPHKEPLGTTHFIHHFLAMVLPLLDTLLYYIPETLILTFPVYGKWGQGTQ